MKRIMLMMTVVSLLAFLLSCNSVKETGQPEIIPEQNNGVQNQAWDYKNIKNLDEGCSITDFPSAAFNPLPDRSIRSLFTGIIVDDPFLRQELDIFPGRLIIQLGASYILYGQKHETVYYGMVFDFTKEISNGAIVSTGDILGFAENTTAKILAFSESLDPFLVINSIAPPVFYAGYFWYNPSFLSPTGSTKWISFDPVNDINEELKELADHLAGGAPGFALYDKRVRFLTKLPQYPRELSGDESKSISPYEAIIYGGKGVITHATELNTGGYTYLLCWQKGFKEYLQKEYTLNDEIWLCGVIVTYNVWEKRGYIFLRDFISVSLEEMYEGRMKGFRGSL